MVRSDLTVRIDFHPDATAELSEAADWYLGQSAKAAQNFAIEIERALARISQNPERFARVGKNCRACSVTRFPFQVVFRFQENHVRVLAIAQCRNALEPDAWSEANVDAAAEHFEQCGIFVPYAAMCETLGCRYADFLRPLRQAAAREFKKYGRRIPEDDQYFVMHRVPPRGIMAPKVDSNEITRAVISFTLCDDIWERLERGEEV